MRNLLAALALAVSVPAFAQEKAPELPRVLLLGDSIRIGYAPLVAKKLDGIAVVVHPGAENCADTPTMLKGLDKWLGEQPFLIVHFNCGLHDLKFDKVKKVHQVPTVTYAENLKAIVERLKKATPNVIFASTTPIIDDRHALRKAAFDRTEADVVKFNAKALATMHGLGITVNDLHRVVHDGDAAKLLSKDGTHYTPEGYDRLADAVADSIRRQLKVLNPPRLKAPASGPDAVKAYREAEVANDALVPKAFKEMTVPAFPVPASKAEWGKQRPAVLAKVVASLGDIPPRPAKPTATLVSAEQRSGFKLERLRIDNGVDGAMSAMLLIPDGLKGPAPAVLWLHSSSFDHTQLLVPNSNGGEEPLGLTLVKRGYVVFAPDAAWYGDRAGQGPAGAKETTREQQDGLHKYNLWFGRTLWGMFIRDDQIALDYLLARPEVDRARIGATGISMGSTRAWWLAAVDERVRSVVGVACLTRYENLIRHGQLRAHGNYYFVNGLLKHFNTEAVVSLIAPRPVLFLTGELDAGSPADGIKVIEEKAGAVYRNIDSPHTFRSVRYPEVGHTYTPEMRTEMLAWFARSFSK